jgi:hypothetical protein
MDMKVLLTDVFKDLSQTVYKLFKGLFGEKDYIVNLYNHILKVIKDFGHVTLKDVRRDSNLC